MTVQVSQPIQFGQPIRLKEDVIFGPIIPLNVTRVFKNGWLEAKSADGRTWVKVRHEDVFSESQVTPERLRRYLDSL